jgi:2-polyprenyl-3-methyl-5-hydroxy-6-metoxy-1,4-benzoquinol methylase
LTVDYQKIPVEDFAKDNAQTFDVVTCLEMLEHVPDPSSIIKSCSALAKDGSLATSKPASAMSMPVTNAPSLARDSAKIPPPQPTSRIFLPLSEPPHCFLMLG